MSKALVIGAGNIGRGFLAEILADSGYAITFCDVNAEILQTLAKRQKYEIIYAGTDKRKEITGFKTVNSADDQVGYEQAVAEADLIMTAIGANLLPRISQQLAAAMNKTVKKRTLMACENAIRASSQWKNEMTKHLSDQAQAMTSFVDVAVDRIVPNIRHENGDVSVEPYKEMVVDDNIDAGAVKLVGIEIAKGGLDPYISRKLFCVNATHAYVAWLGTIEGFTYVHEAMSYTPIIHAAKGLLKELVEVLVAAYGMDRAQTQAYCEKVLHRFANPSLQDTLERVGRNVLRKIGPNERFVTPINIAIEHGLEHQELLRALHAAANAILPGDPESRTLNEEIKKLGLGKALAKHTGLSEEITRRI